MDQQLILPVTYKWADRIRAAWHKGVDSILESARLLNEALEDSDCDRAELVKLLPFSKSLASRLAKIGSDSRLVSHAKLLPSDATTMYYLSRLSDERFSALIEGGCIHPGMKRNEASAETRQERKEADEARVLSLMPREGTYRSLVIDPPWDYEWLSIAGRAAPGYATMTHEELLEFDVGQWADDICHLYLWTTNNFMARACQLMEVWGFQHKTVLTWVKPRWGLGAYFRNSTEHVLFGLRGDTGTRSDSIATHFEAPLGEHSEKPEEFYDIVRAASYPPYGEVFQRTERSDFANVFRSGQQMANEGAGQDTEAGL